MYAIIELYPGFREIELYPGFGYLLMSGGEGALILLLSYGILCNYDNFF